jgi:iron-sulfur cluster repair protein YtfE (RIC family)
MKPIETEMFDLTGEMTVNAVIARHPETVAAFKRLGIDACCGGAHSLWEVSKRHRIDFVSLLTELERG